MKSATGNTKNSPRPLARDEMPLEVPDIVNATHAQNFTCRNNRRMKLHTVLKSLMATKKESARGAAKACGVPLSTFTGYLKPGKRQVDPTHLMAIARHYDVTIDFLLGIPEKHKLDQIPTKTLFSKWVRLTIEDIADGSSVSKILNEDDDK